MSETLLKNNIKTYIEKLENTPRIALTLNLSIDSPEKYAGQYSLMNRLLMQGTKKYSSQELATLLDENAIELYTEMKYDYLRFRFVCLNEDFELALSILSDIIQNSTFEDFEKERIKLKGELQAELDSARVKIADLFTRTAYQNHYYGNSYNKVLEQVDNVTFSDVKSAYVEILNSSQKVLTVVGDADDAVSTILDKYIGMIPNSVENNDQIPYPEKIVGKKSSEIIKEDAQQAQIIQGWLVPTIGSDDYEKLMLLNIILGASGLSSRLFRELREKKGLAYTVRSSYETHAKSAIFSIYIGTEPSNVETSINGFNIEIEKIKNELISEEELSNAKNNIIGKQQFLTETNSQLANLMAYYAIMGKPFVYQLDVIERIKNITAQDLKECANKYFTENYALAILKP